ncbi:hypothetical protein LP7551_02047 [Roseibium album]|nr:hypothetical protein LP7551_02047 [Roseibium album]
MKLSNLLIAIVAVLALAISVYTFTLISKPTTQTYTAYETQVLSPSNPNDLISVLHSQAGTQTVVNLEMCVPSNSQVVLDIYLENKRISSIGQTIGSGPGAFVLGCTSINVAGGAHIGAKILQGNQAILLKKIRQIH